MIFYVMNECTESECFIENNEQVLNMKMENVSGFRPTGPIICKILVFVSLLSS